MGFCTITSPVEGIIGEDEATFMAMTGLDEVTAKGLYAAAQAVAELTGVGGADEDEEAVEEEAVGEEN